MKKIFVLWIVLLALVGCAQAPQESFSTEPPAPTPTKNPYDATIGICLTEQTLFNKGFTEELKTLFAKDNCELIVEYADNNLNKQLSTGVALLNERGAEVLIVDPVDIDECEPLIAECEGVGAHIINVVTPINGKIDVLIAPDYLKLGAMARTQVNQLTQGKENPQIVVLEGSFDGFRTQMISDGFMGDKPVTATSLFCNYDKETAKTQLNSVLAEKTPDIIFSHSSSMTLGALSALSEADKTVPIVTLGGDSEMMRELSNGKIAYALYFDPTELSQKVYETAKAYITGTAVTHKYAELSVYGVGEENMDTAYTIGQPYAHGY